jgi:hypothetical protein
MEFVAHPDDTPINYESGEVSFRDSRLDDRAWAPSNSSGTREIAQQKSGVITLVIYCN